MSKWSRRKSNTKFFTFRGKAVYVKPYVPDEYNGKEMWKCGMTVTKEEWQKLRESGCQLKKRIAEEVPNIDENTPYVVFNRDAEKEFATNTAYFCPPFIYDKDGELLVHYEDESGEPVRQFNDETQKINRVGEPFLIGNGSDIEVTVAIYPAGSFGHGTRLESIKVLDLVVYEPEEGKESDTQSKAKKETFKRETKKIEKEELDDEIPFEVKDTAESGEDEIGW